MKIVVIPETNEEKAKFSMSEHEHVREFMLFGNKLDADKDVIDFHDWSGSYRYIQTGLTWYQDVVKEAKSSEERKAEAMRSFGPPGRAPVATPVVQPQVQAQTTSPFVEAVGPVIQEPTVAEDVPSPVIEEKK